MKTKLILLVALFAFVSTTVSAQVQRVRDERGHVVYEHNDVVTGFEVAQALSPDGTKLIEMPYKWFAATATADDEQVAIELAQRDAFAIISRVVSNAVYDVSERYATVCNDKVREYVKSYWEQFSQSVIRGCEPFGSVKIDYDPCTRNYTATARVAMRGDRYNKLLGEYEEARPAELTGAEVNIFTEINVAVISILKETNE